MPGSTHRRSPKTILTSEEQINQPDPTTGSAGRPGPPTAGGDFDSAEHVESGETAEISPVPSGNGSRSTAESEKAVPSPDFNDPDPFPLEGGTGTGRFGASQRPVPTVRERVGTRERVEVSTPYRFVFPEQASAASAPVSTGLPPQAGTSWYRKDLAETVGCLVAGTLDRPRPTVGRLSDGSYWLYLGCTNGLAAESGRG